MTILEAIRAVDRSYPNDYSDVEKLQWLSTFDGQVYRDVIATHEGAAVDSFDGYGSTTDIESTNLLIASPYDEVYPLFLAMRIHLMNADTSRAELLSADYERAYKSYTDWYNRTHLPKGIPNIRF